MDFTLPFKLAKVPPVVVLDIVVELSVTLPPMKSTKSLELSALE